MDNANDFAVILVHGTWSSPKIWEYLDQRILAIFPGLPVKRIKWNGRNTGAGRADGTQKFEKEARKYQRVVTVCHSHGINAVLDAADDVTDRILLNIALNGPMLSVQPVPLPWGFWAVIVGISLFLVGPSTGVFLFFLEQFASYGVAWYLGLLLVALISAYALFRAVQTWAAFLLVPATFAIVVYQVYLRAVQDLDHIVLGSTAKDPKVQRIIVDQILPAIPTGWLWNLLFWGACLLVFTLPFCVIGSLYSSRSLRHPAKRARIEHSTLRIRHLLKQTDEIQLTLAFAMAFQRIVELPQIWLSSLAETPWLLWAVGLTAGGCSLLTQLNVPDPFNWFGIVIGSAIIIFASLVILKLLLFGAAYGWDVAGLSPDHLIYVSPGLPNRSVDLFVVPRSTNVDIGHMSIHSDPRVAHEVIRLLREVLPKSMSE